MKYIFTLNFFLLVCTLQSRAQNKTYYVSTAGNDANNGLSINNAWKTISKVNSVAFQPGDVILFEGGKTFSGTIDLSNTNNGTATSPVTYSSYGSTNALISSGSAIGLFSYNKSGITIRKLTFTGDPASNGADGVNFYAYQGSFTQNIILDSLEVYGYGNTGITVGTDTTNGYKNVRITHCIVHDNASAGIFTYGKGDAYSNSDFYIGYCKAYNNLGFPLNDNTGNGILLAGVNNGTIEYCEAYNNGQNNTNNSGGPVGIWTYNSNKVIIQYCESHHNKAGSVTDGGGFDIDGGSQNCIIQYCYSHDNEGAGYALFEYGSSNPFANNTIRYNISQNDGRKNSYGAISFWGGNKSITNSSVYNNTVYIDNSTGVVNGTPTAVQVISGNLSNIVVANNIFYVSGSANLVTAQNTAPGTSVINFKNNDYFSSGVTNFIWGGIPYSTFASWRTASGQETNGSTPTGFNVNPVLVAPGSGGLVHPADGNSLASVTGYKLQSSSPLIDKGLNLTNMGANDYYGVPIPYNNTYDIGANEYSLVVVPPPPPPASAFNFISFTGNVVSDHALLIWKVSNELNVKSYEIQKSADGINFHAIGNVAATSATDYNFSDNNYTASVDQYYRIRAIDNKDNSTFSAVIRIDKQSIITASLYYAEGTGLVIRLTNSTPEAMDVSIYDAGGKKLLKVKETLNSGGNTINIREPLGWPKGIYIVHLSFKEELSFKFIK